MYLTINFESILTQSIEKDLVWFENEFDCIFGCKRELTTHDKILGDIILEKLTEVLKAYHNDQLLGSFLNSIYNIRKKYPQFF